MICGFRKKDYLVSDDAALCHLAFERGCLDHLSTLIHSISPLEPLQPEWEEGEPESLMALREVCTFFLTLPEIEGRSTDGKFPMYRQH